MYLSLTVSVNPTYTAYYASSTFTLRPLRYNPICSITCAKMLLCAYIFLSLVLRLVLYIYQHIHLKLSKIGTRARGLVVEHSHPTTKEIGIDHTGFLASYRHVAA